ncbi:hypothetical protein U9S71_20400, partial [Parapedobacter sp. 10938]|nr:hypothetical protein [Parapedobacter sp. 10938]
QFANPYLALGNSPVIYVDPNGEWIHLVVGAVVGGVANLTIKAFQGKIDSWGDGFAAFGIGAAAGFAATATGGAALTASGLGATTVAGGVVFGAASSAAASPIQGIGNALYFGDPYGPGDFAKGVLFGAVTGGATVGVSNLIRGTNFWTGAPKVVSGPPTITKFGDRDVVVPYKQIDPKSSAGWKGLNVADENHVFSNLVDNSMQEAAKFTIKGGDGIYRSLYQIQGSLRGQIGVFEWIVETGGNVTHRVFIPNGKITGIPNMWPK